MTFTNAWQRIGAFLLDYLIIAAYLVLLVIISVGLGFGPLRSVFRALFADPNSSEFSAFLLLVLPVHSLLCLIRMLLMASNMGQEEEGIMRRRYAWCSTELATLLCTLFPQICAMGINTCLHLARSGLAPCSHHSFAHHYSRAGTGLDLGGSLLGEHARE